MCPVSLFKLSENDPYNLFTSIHLWKARASVVRTPGACCANLNNGISDHVQALAGKVIGVGEWTLGGCLQKVHKDIITCWNFRGEVYC